MLLKRGILGLLIVCLLALASVSFAQGQGQGNTIQIGQNATGTLTAESSTAQFTLMATGGEAVQIQVLAISAGFAPHFSVLNPAGVAILTASNADAKAVLTETVTLDDAGSYTIVVSGENGSTGQFLLSLQAGVALPPPVILTINQPVTGTVGTQTPVQVYRFDTTSLGAVGVIVLSQTPGSGALVMLFDESSGKTIASSDASLVGVAYQLPANAHVYRVEVSASGTQDTAFSICIGSCSSGVQTGAANVQPTPATIIVPPVATPEVAASACSAASIAGGAVNLRSGPGTIYAIFAMLPVGQSVPVSGVWTGGAWYEVNFNGVSLWVAGSVAGLTGDCSALPKVATPTNAPLAPTAVPTQAPTLAPTQPETQPTATAMVNLPDLTTTNLQLSQAGDGSLNATVTILNAGTAPLTADQTFAVLICVDGFDNCNEVDNQSIPLQPGETVSVTYAVPSFSGSGNHTVNVTLDGRSEVSESNESNNTAFASFNN